MSNHKSDDTERAGKSPDAGGPEETPATPDAGGSGQTPPWVDAEGREEAPPPPEAISPEQTPPEAGEPERIPPAPGAGSAFPPVESPAHPDARPAEPEPEPEPAPAPVTAADERPRERAAEEHEENAEEHHYEEGGGWSFAARALVVLLLLIAGAALGIWGAPKLAPMLPSGLAPVAEWLTPGAREIDTQLAALEARLDGELGEVRSRLEEAPVAADVDGRIGAAVGDLESRLAGEIDAIRQAIGETDSTELGQRLSRVESTIEGQVAELGTLKEQLAGATGQLSQDALESIDVYRAELEGLRAEVGTLRDQVSALSTRIDDVTANAEREIAAAQSRVEEVRAEATASLSAAEIEANLALIRAAVAGGQPFEEPLAQLAEQPDVTVPEGLTAAAPGGVATMAALRDSYPDAAHAAIRASIHASAGDGVLARSRAFIRAQMASRSLTPREGSDPDAVLSRMEDRLREDDLHGVLAESEGLPSEAAAAMSGWLDAARRRAAAVDGLAELGTSLAAMN